MKLFRVDYHTCYGYINADNVSEAKNVLVDSGVDMFVQENDTLFFNGRDAVSFQDVSDKRDDIEKYLSDLKKSMGDGYISGINLEQTKGIMFLTAAG